MKRGGESGREVVQRRCEGDEEVHVDGVNGGWAVLARMWKEENAIKVYGREKE